MHKSIYISTGLILSGCLASLAQTPQTGFQQFRQQILSNYSNFKSRILQHYDDFLNGEWHEFEPIAELESPYTEPKPEKAPEFVETEASATDLQESIQITSQLNNMSLPDFSDSSQSKGINLHFDGDFANFESVDTPDKDFIFGPHPGQKPLPFPGDCDIINSDENCANLKNKFFFDFYGMKAYIPDIPFDILKEFEGFTETGTHWKMMASQTGGVETARQLFGLAWQHGLNGYLTFRLTEAYVNQRFADSDQNAKMSAVHFLLSNMGYDVRLLMANDFLTVMMPFDQKIVYSSLSLTETNGRKYTILFPEGRERKKGESFMMRTCKMPTEATGKTSDLRLKGLNLPMKPKEFSINCRQVTLNGVVNENLKSMFYHYPQMPNGDFASSCLDNDLRQNLIRQIKEQLGGMTPKDAINSLMAFCHYGFKYKSDQAWHIFEKPYFVEENFLYEYNDCEDRAMFMSYLIWNALDLPCQLIQYPGHESVAVMVNEQLPGRYYNTDGLNFYSADPTYVGSCIGYVMPRYEDTAPSIDKLYK